MMTLFTTMDPGSLASLVDFDDDGPLLWSETVVLRDASGRIGFELPGGDEILRSLLGNVVLVAAVNGPSWFEEYNGSVTARKVAVTGSVVLACTDPDEAIIEELKKVQRNGDRTKKNEILVRHGRAPLPLEESIFSRWVSEDGRLQSSALRWIVPRCAQVSLWYRRDGGYAGRLLGLSASEAERPIARASKVSHFRIVRVETQADLPSW